MKTSLNLALLISDTEKGKELFITLLEYVKSINPTLADTYWSLYDNEKTVIQRRFYKIQINKPPAEGKG
jgi:hypothetical protein